MRFCGNSWMACPKFPEAATLSNRASTACARKRQHCFVSVRTSGWGPGLGQLAHEGARVSLLRFLRWQPIQRRRGPPMTQDAACGEIH